MVRLCCKPPLQLFVLPLQDFILRRKTIRDSKSWTNRETNKREPTLCLRASTIRSRPPRTLSSFFDALKASPMAETSTWDWNDLEIHHRLKPASPSCCRSRSGFTHKLAALEQVAVEGVGCRVSSHEAQHFG